MKKLIVNKNKCIGCGTCVALCEACFKLNEEGKAEVIVKECKDQNCDLEEVIDSCAVKAMSYE